MFEVNVISLTHTKLNEGQLHWKVHKNLIDTNKYIEYIRPLASRFSNIDVMYSLKNILQIRPEI